MTIRAVLAASRYVLSLTLLLTLCTRGSDGAVVNNADSDKVTSNTEDTSPVLFGFADSALLNISVTATINPTTGAFKSASSGPVPFFANGAAVASNSKFLYIPNSFINGQANNGSQIFGYSINPPSRTLTPIPGSPFFHFAPPTSLQGLATTPDGRFLYGSDDTGRIFAFRLDTETGVPTEIPGSPFDSGANAQLVVDPSGKFLYASDDGGSGGILAFKIDSIGALTSVHGSPFAIPGSTLFNNSQPYGIVDTGGFIYTALTATNQIAAFSVDNETGILTPVLGSPYPTGFFPTVIALANNFLYVVNAGDGNITGYSLNPRSGELTPIPGSPFGTDGATIASDASGKHLYLSRHNGIQGYRINSTTGTLTLSTGAHFGEDGPLWLTIVQAPSAATE